MTLTTTHKLLLPEGTPLLEINSPTFLGDFQKASGLGPNDRIEVFGPQFERTDGLDVGLAPICLAEWQYLTNLPAAELKKKGLCLWDDEGDMHLYLLPGQWYNAIPAGLVLTDINGGKEEFKPGITDDDIRFGCLPYGILVPPGQ